MKTKFFAAIVFLVLFRNQAAFAQELAQKFTTPEGFSIRLPADWKRIDKQTISDALNDLKKDVPNARPPNGPSDGFQPKSIAQGFGYPRILVIPNKLPGGKLSDQNFKQYAAFLKQQMQKSADDALDKNSLNASLTIKDVNYDEQKKVLHVISKMSLPDLGIMQQMDAVFLSESGMVTFQLTFVENESLQKTNLFPNIIGSIEIPKKDQYEPKTTEK